MTFRWLSPLSAAVLAVSLCGCPALLSDDWTTVPLEAGTLVADAKGTAVPDVGDQTTESSTDSGQPEGDVALAPRDANPDTTVSDANTPDAVDLESGSCAPPFTTTMGRTFATAQADGTVLNDSLATPAACQCATEYTCACVIANAPLAPACTNGVAGCHIVVAHGGTENFVEVTCN